ncbi:MAG: CBS domain-containing protein [Gammaproteobacteria bacterium]|nr:CBS domain-containing protein [Gammaproteobacteria bacterium]
MSAGAISNREVVIAEPRTGVVEAARRTRERHVDCLVVCEPAGSANRPVGIVTDRDLVLEVLAENLDPAAVTLGDLSGQQLVTAHEADGIWETILRMRTLGLHRMPVVDDTGGLSGLLTLDDLLELLADELNQLASVTAGSMKKEKQTRPPH